MELVISLGDRAKTLSARQSMKWLWIVRTATREAAGVLRTVWCQQKPVWESDLCAETSPRGKEEPSVADDRRTCEGHPSQRRPEEGEHSPSALLNNDCKYVTPTGSKKKWKEVQKLVVTMPSRCCDVCMCVFSSSFVFPLPHFLTPSCSCLTWMPVAKWGGSCGSRETKGKVAIVTEAKENSSSSSPQSPSQGEAVETSLAGDGPSSRGAGRALLSTQLVSPPSLLAV